MLLNAILSTLIFEVLCQYNLSRINLLFNFYGVLRSKENPNAHNAVSFWRYHETIECFSINLFLYFQPENILCMTRTGNQIKIIDFGLARKFEPMKQLQILFGTPEFVAPEVVNFEPVGKSSFSFMHGSYSIV